jgi:hypothetical protein
MRAWSVRILCAISIAVTSSTAVWMVWAVPAKAGLVSFDGFWQTYPLAVIAALLAAFMCFRRLSRPLAPWRVPRATAVKPA